MWMIAWTLTKAALSQKYQRCLIRILPPSCMQYVYYQVMCSVTYYRVMRSLILPLSYVWCIFIIF